VTAGSDGLVSLDAAAYQQLRIDAAVGVLTSARKLVAAAVADGRISADREKFWTTKIVRDGAAAEVALAKLTPVAVEAAESTPDLSSWVV